MIDTLPPARARWSKARIVHAPFGYRDRAAAAPRSQIGRLPHKFDGRLSRRGELIRRPRAGAFCLVAPSSVAGARVGRWAVRSSTGEPIQERLALCMVERHGRVARRHQARLEHLVEDLLGLRACARSAGGPVDLSVVRERDVRLDLARSVTVVAYRDEDVRDDVTSEARAASIGTGQYWGRRCAIDARLLTTEHRRTGKNKDCEKASRSEQWSH